MSVRGMWPDLSRHEKVRLRIIINEIPQCLHLDVHYSKLFLLLFCEDRYFIFDKSQSKKHF